MIIWYVFAGIFSTQIQHQIHSLLYYFLPIFISLMRSQQSIHIPHRLDRHRKALMTQLTANIAKTAAATPKRSKAQQYDEWHDLQTLKKKQHIDVNAQDKKQNAKLIKQNDRKFCTQKQIPIKPNTFSDPKFLDSTQKKTFKNINKQESFDPNFQPFKPTDLNLMLDHKLFNLGSLSVQDSKLFSEKERLLISIQEKLDSHILFLKEHRKKKKGELFSVIKKTFLENYRIFLEFSHIKKILYICENFYSIQKFGDGFSFDCLVDIKLSSKQSDEKSFEDELNERKNEFRAKLFSYKENFDGNTNTKQFEIPEVKFQFEQVLEKKNNLLKSSMKQLFDGQLIKKKKLDRFFVLEKKTSTFYEESKKNLQKGMKKVESIIKKEKELDLGMFSNKIFEKRQLNEKQIKAIIHEITMIYRQKNVMNMLECHLIEGLSKKMILAEGILTQVVEIFLELSPKVNKSKSFMTLINHKLGKIIKLDSSRAQQFEKCVISNTQWMKMFEFKIEMNGEYLKSKMKQQRDKLYQQLEREEKDKLVRDENQNDLKTCEQKAEAIKQIKNKGEEQNVKNNVKSPLKEHGFSEQQEKANYFQENQNGHFIKISEAHREQHLSIQKDDFHSTLSNSAEIFYQDENQADNEAKC